MCHPHWRRFSGDGHFPYLVRAFASRRYRSRYRNRRRNRICSRHQRMARHYRRFIHGRTPHTFRHGTFRRLFHPLHQRVPQDFQAHGIPQRIRHRRCRRNRLAYSLHSHHHSRLAHFVPIRGHSPHPLDWRHFSRHRVHGLHVRHRPHSHPHELWQKFKTRNRHGQVGRSHQGRHPL